jgi:hypothetical protein
LVVRHERRQVDDDTKEFPGLRTRKRLPPGDDGLNDSVGRILQIGRRSGGTALVARGGRSERREHGFDFFWLHRRPSHD